MGSASESSVPNTSSMVGIVGVTETAETEEIDVDDIEENDGFPSSVAEDGGLRNCIFGDELLFSYFTESDDDGGGWSAGDSWAGMDGEGFCNGGRGCCDSTAWPF